jgi:hypothetical protein
MMTHDLELLDIISTQQALLWLYRVEKSLRFHLGTPIRSEPAPSWTGLFYRPVHQKQNPTRRTCGAPKVVGGR